MDNHFGRLRIISPAESTILINGIIIATVPAGDVCVDFHEILQQGLAKSPPQCRTDGENLLIVLYQKNDPECWVDLLIQCSAVVTRLFSPSFTIKPIWMNPEFQAVYRLTEGPVPRDVEWIKLAYPVLSPMGPDSLVGRTAPPQDTVEYPRDCDFARILNGC